MEAGLYVGQLLLLPVDLAAAAVAASSAAVAAALAGLPVSGAKAAAGATKRLSDEQFELYLEVGAAARSFGCCYHRSMGHAPASTAEPASDFCTMLHWLSAAGGVQSAA